MIEGNFIGTDISGTTSLSLISPNETVRIGVQLWGGSTGNTIGGTTAAARNVIVGINLPAVLMTDAGTSGNVVEGNYIGTNASGTAAIPNTGEGVLIDGGASGNTIGGASNVISGNAGDGVEISGAGTSGNLVDSNFIGTDATGTFAIGDGNDGVEIDSGASGNIVGGTTPEATNLISGNANGVEINDSSLNLVQGNMIGTDTTGTLAIGNTGAGVLVDAGSSANTIGGPVGGAAQLDLGERGRGDDRGRRPDRHARGREPDRHRHQRHVERAQPDRRHHHHGRLGHHHRRCRHAGPQCDLGEQGRRHRHRQRCG